MKQKIMQVLRLTGATDQPTAGRGARSAGSTDTSAPAGGALLDGAAPAGGHRRLHEIYFPRHLHAVIRRERARADRQKAQFSLVMFRLVPAGTRLSVLRLARLVLDEVRTTDEVGQLDKQTVVAILPETLPTGAWTFVQRVCERAGRYTFHVEPVLYTYPSNWVDSPISPLPAGGGQAVPCGDAADSVSQAGAHPAAAPQPAGQSVDPAGVAAARLDRHPAAPGPDSAEAFHAQISSTEFGSAGVGTYPAGSAELAGDQATGLADFAPMASAIASRGRNFFGDYARFTRADARRIETDTGGASAIDLSTGDLTNHGFSTDDASESHVSTADVSTADVSTADVSTADVSTGDVSTADASTGDVLLGDSSTAGFSAAVLDTPCHTASRQTIDATRRALSAVEAQRYDLLDRAQPKSARPPAPKPLPMEDLVIHRPSTVKRLLDVGIAAAVLLPVSPLLAGIAIAIKFTSPGPIIFRQWRTGWGGKPFQIWKFRTMCADAEKQKAALRAISEQDGPAFKLTCDPRVTKIGALLRKTSLDELPQLWNVIRGDMSLVGPRPLPIDEQALCDQWHKSRLDVMPGLTCIWQVKGRSRVSFEEWMRMDLGYIRRYRVWRDLRIMFATVPAVLLRRGAK